MDRQTKRQTDGWTGDRYTGRQTDEQREKDGQRETDNRQT